MKFVVKRMSQTLEKQLESWHAVEKAADYIHERPFLHRPVNLHKHDGLDFKFEQMYNPERAASLQDEISDMVNAERWQA